MNRWSWKRLLSPIRRLPYFCELTKTSSEFFHSSCFLSPGHFPSFWVFSTHLTAPNCQGYTKLCIQFLDPFVTIRPYHYTSRSYSNHLRYSRFWGNTFRIVGCGSSGFPSETTAKLLLVSSSSAKLTCSFLAGDVSLHLSCSFWFSLLDFPHCIILIIHDSLW